MNLSNERPLSELWTEDQRRLRAREVDLIIARHRLVYAASKLAAEAERLNPIKEFLS
jgi:hypothetical protein